MSESDAAGVLTASTAATRVRRRGSRRLRGRDGRLLTGALLLVLSVLLGTHVVSAAARTQPMVVVTRALPAGQPLTVADLGIVDVRLATASDEYWPAADLGGLSGHPLLEPVAAGQLLPRSGVAATIDPTASAVVSVPVDPDRLPTLSPGDQVDVYATYSAATSTPGRTVLVAAQARYDGGGDADSDSDVAVLLSVPVDAAAAMVRASEVASLDIVLDVPPGPAAGT